MSLNRLLTARRTVSQEDNTDGLTRKELEYVFFLKANDLSQLDRCTSEEMQEQWTIFIEPTTYNPNKGQVRVRSIDKRKFILTSKVVQPDGSRNENELEVTKEFYEQFKLLAPDGFRKRRCRFPVTGTDLVWEVDLFYDHNGNPVDWVKLDLEVPEPLDSIPEFPITYSQAIVNQPGKRTMEEEVIVRQLFEKEYSLWDKDSLESLAK